MITFSELGLWGRFGNQLHQIASTIGVATKNGVEFSFPFWEHSKYFEYQLPFLNRKYFLELPEAYTGYVDYKINPQYDYDMKGYFQSYKYHEHCYQLLDFYFTPLKKPEKPYDYALENIAIHVRRGDYLTLSRVHPVLGMDYYNKAMSLFPDKCFTVFSDDIDWCKENFDHDRCTFVCSGNAVDQWVYMRQHSGFIVANSSYSWWAAYLNPGKPVVAPQTWVNNEPPEVIEDRLPKEWIRL